MDQYNVAQSSWPQLLMAPLVWHVLLKWGEKGWSPQEVTFIVAFKQCHFITIEAVETKEMQKLLKSKERLIIDVICTIFNIFFWLGEWKS